MHAIPLERDLPASKPAYSWCPSSSMEDWPWWTRDRVPWDLVTFLLTYQLFRNPPIWFHYKQKALKTDTQTLQIYKHANPSTSSPPSSVPRLSMRKAPLSSEEFEHIVKLLPGQTRVYLRGFACAWNKSTAHPYTMSTIDTLSAIQRDIIHTRLSFKFSLLPEGAGDLLNFIRLEMGSALALMIGKFIIGVCSNGSIQRCCTRPVIPSIGMVASSTGGDHEPDFLGPPSQPPRMKRSAEVRIGLNSQNG